MAEQNWSLRGEYMESCNCDYLCPCIYTNPQGPATHDHCTALMAFRGKAYLFSSQGQVWTVIEGGAANAGPIPFPAGVTSMQAIGAEVGLDGLPLVIFRSNGDNSRQYVTRWDGTRPSTQPPSPSNR